VSKPNAKVVEVLAVGEPIIALFDNGDKTRCVHHVVTSEGRPTVPWTGDDQSHPPQSPRPLARLCVPASHLLPPPSTPGLSLCHTLSSHVPFLTLPSMTQGDRDLLQAPCSGYVVPAGWSTGYPCGLHHPTDNPCAVCWQYVLLLPFSQLRFLCCVAVQGACCCCTTGSTWACRSLTGR
jgi:hypothetical protein